MVMCAEQTGLGKEITFTGSIQDNLATCRRKTCQAHFTFDYVINGIYFVTEAEDTLPLTDIHGARCESKLIRELFYPIFH